MHRPCALALGISPCCIAFVHSHASAFVHSHASAFVHSHASAFVHSHSCISLRAFAFMHQPSCIRIRASAFVHSHSCISLFVTIEVLWCLQVSCECYRYHQHRRRPSRLPAEPPHLAMHVGIGLCAELRLVHVCMCAVVCSYSRMHLSIRPPARPPTLRRACAILYVAGAYRLCCDDVWKQVVAAHASRHAGRHSTGSERRCKTVSWYSRRVPGAL